MKRLNLSNEQLIQAYNQAKKLNLDETFIYMLKEEIETRDLLKRIHPSDTCSTKDLFLV